MAFFDSASNIIELTANDFDLSGAKPVLKKKHDGMILVYASYCVYCTMVKPEWLRLGGEMKKSQGKVYALQSDNPGNMEVIEYIELNGVPHIAYMKSSGEIDTEKYTKERTADDFMKYYKKKSGSDKKTAPKKKKTAVLQTGGAKRKKRVKKKNSKKKKDTKSSTKKKDSKSSKKKKRVPRRVKKNISSKKSKKKNPKVKF